MQIVLLNYLSCSVMLAKHKTAAFAGTITFFLFALLHFTWCALENVSSKRQAITTLEEHCRPNTAVPFHNVKLNCSRLWCTGSRKCNVRTQLERITPVCVGRDRIKSWACWEKYCIQFQFVSHPSAPEYETNCLFLEIDHCANFNDVSTSRPFS